MAIKIPVPTTSWASSLVTLGGKEYDLTFSFNSYDQRWRFDLYQAGDPVILGVTIIESQSLLSKYILDDFSHGDIYCVRFLDSIEPAGRDNLGFNKPYELVYLTNTEILELTIE